jgi:methylmalonic aciduria homocystinuria type C protein
MQIPAWQAVHAALADAYVAAGLDLVQPFAVSWYNAVVAEPQRLPTFGRDECLGILIGNTRALWPRFLGALAADPRRLAADDPLDDYVESVVNAACAGLSFSWECVWAHGSRRIAIQQLAQQAGVAYLSPGRLSVHSIFGPWIALRAAIVVDVDGPSGPSPLVAPPCDDCHVRCQPAFARAAATLIEPVNQAAVTPHWRLWLAARDACPLGCAYRYDDAQIGYHYTKDKDFLRQALALAVSP